MSLQVEKLEKNMAKLTIEVSADELEKASDFDSAVQDLIKRTVTEHQRVIFNGDGYSDEWVAEAEKLGFKRIFISKNNLKGWKPSTNIQVIGVSTLKEALYLALG